MGANCILVAWLQFAPSIASYPSQQLVTLLPWLSQLLALVGKLASLSCQRRGLTQSDHHRCACRRLGWSGTLHSAPRFMP